MTFAEWVSTQPYGTLTRLMRETGVSYMTLLAMKKGRPARGSIASKVSEATRVVDEHGNVGEPAVSIVELVCPPASAQSGEHPAAPTAERRGA
ncbi:MAG TPA: hypothetical protein VK524_22380 [Polyangiaceae bacterium]|nr:hypothetical protein [Polyangiaceae bacterium]